MDEQNDQQPAENQQQDDRRNQLEAVKKQALEVLVPIVDQIQDSPDRRFDILMTAARSSGDTTVLAKALEAAQQIENVSEKASAVVDVLNEVNYNLLDK